MQNIRQMFHNQAMKENQKKEKIEEFKSQSKKEEEEEVKNLSERKKLAGCETFV